MTGIWAHAAGTLVRDPERRASAKGNFSIASVRIGSGDDVAWVNVLAFGDAGARLLTLKGGDPLAVSGRAEVRTWTARDGSTKSCLSIVAGEIAAARPRPRSRERANSAHQHLRGHHRGNGAKLPFDDEIPF